MFWTCGLNFKKGGQLYFYTAIYQAKLEKEGYVEELNKQIASFFSRLKFQPLAL